MSLIERKWIGLGTGATALQYAQDCGVGQVVEYVPAADHQGAVSLLDDLADVLADVRAGIVPADGSVVRDALKRAAHHVAGGQS